MKVGITKEIKTLNRSKENKTFNWKLKLVLDHVFKKINTF